MTGGRLPFRRAQTGVRAVGGTPSVKRSLVAAAGAGAAALAVHAAPAITTNRPLRRRLFPQLSGIGLPDHVALTFDDGPDPASTPAFLERLDQLGWKATFFMLGSMVRAAPALAAEVAAAGHEVAPHGEAHVSQLRRPGWVIRDDLARGLEAVVEATGREPRWFRPPYGVITTPGLLAADRHGLRTVLWTAWGRDWRAEATAETVAADVETQLRPGATVLLHDSDCTSAPQSWRAALDALPLLAESFEARGLAVGPLADHGIGAGVSRPVATRRAVAAA